MTWPQAGTELSRSWGPAGLWAGGSGSSLCGLGLPHSMEAQHPQGGRGLPGRFGGPAHRSLPAHAVGAAVTGQLRFWPASRFLCWIGQRAACKGRWWHLCRRGHGHTARPLEPRGCAEPGAAPCSAVGYTVVLAQGLEGRTRGLLASGSSRGAGVFPTGQKRPRRREPTGSQREARGEMAQEAGADAPAGQGNSGRRVLGVRVSAGPIEAPAAAGLL